MPNSHKVIPEFTRDQRSMAISYLKRSYPHRTICQLIRELSKKAEEYGDPSIFDLCCEAIYRAKQMQAKLEQAKMLRDIYEVDLGPSVGQVTPAERARDQSTPT